MRFLFGFLVDNELVGLINLTPTSNFCAMVYNVAIDEDIIKEVDLLEVMLRGINKFIGNTGLNNNQHTQNDLTLITYADNSEKQSFLKSGYIDTKVSRTRTNPERPEEFLLVKKISVHSTIS